MTSLSVLYHRIKGASLAWIICPCRRPLPPEFVKSSGWPGVVLAQLGPLGWLERVTKLVWRSTAETWPATGIACAKQSRWLLRGMYALKAQAACWLSQWWHGCRVSKRMNLWCEHPDLFPVSSELRAIGKLVLRGTWILIPSKLRTQVLVHAHEGHPGIVSMKQRLQAKVWWPGNDRRAERFSKTCHECQLVSCLANPVTKRPMARSSCWSVRAVTVQRLCSSRSRLLEQILWNWGNAVQNIWRRFSQPTVCHCHWLAIPRGSWCRPLEDHPFMAPSAFGGRATK